MHDRPGFSIVTGFWTNHTQSYSSWKASLGVTVGRATLHKYLGDFHEQSVRLQKSAYSYLYRYFGVDLASFSRRSFPTNAWFLERLGHRPFPRRLSFRSIGSQHDATVTVFTVRLGNFTAEPSVPGRYRRGFINLKSFQRDSWGDLGHGT